MHRNIDPVWWANHSTASDEWNFCLNLGDDCGQVMEERYATFITKAHIDKFASVGVNLLRIPTTYAAWIDLPWSALYSGNQTKYLKDITDYAIEEYDMHIILGLHSLPGGVNALDIGEAAGHLGWFNNATNLAYSLQAVDEVLSFIMNSAYPQSFTIAPLNEAIDYAPGIGDYATGTALTANGSAWVNNYFQEVIPRVTAVEPRIPIMLQDSWKGEAFWAPYFPNDTNLVIDTHIYYNWIAASFSSNVSTLVCQRAVTVAGSGKFPVFVGEWATQTLNENLLSNRKRVFDAMRSAYSNFGLSGSAFWSGRFEGNTAVTGEGVTSDYWGYLNLIDGGAIVNSSSISYC